MIIYLVAAAAVVDAFAGGIFVGHRIGSNSVQTAALNILQKAQALPVVAKVTTETKALVADVKPVVAKVETEAEALKAKLEALTAQAKATL